tara:strand:+ start:6330 stop:6584 length:255 start_codon:yes stop_codon:yes gene_type:complete
MKKADIIEMKENMEEEIVYGKVDDLSDDDDDEITVEDKIELEKKRLIENNFKEQVAIFKAELIRSLSEGPGNNINLINYIEEKL